MQLLRAHIFRPLPTLRRSGANALDILHPTLHLAVTATWNGREKRAEVVCGRGTVASLATRLFAGFVEFGVEVCYRRLALQTKLKVRHNMSQLYSLQYDRLPLNDTLFSADLPFDGYRTHTS